MRETHQAAANKINDCNYFKCEQTFIISLIDVLLYYMNYVLGLDIALLFIVILTRSSSLHYWPLDGDQPSGSQDNVVGHLM